MKKSILKDISSKASKVAIQKHLKLVVANVPFSDNFLGNANTLNFDDNVLNGMVVGVDAVDITDDILTLLRSDREKALQNDNLDNSDDNK